MWIITAINKITAIAINPIKTNPTINPHKLNFIGSSWSLLFLIVRPHTLSGHYVKVFTIVPEDIDEMGE
jgi:hypothetical protein